MDTSSVKTKMGNQEPVKLETDNHKNVHQKTESHENKDHEYEHFENEDEETEEHVVPSDSESAESFEVEIGAMDTTEEKMGNQESDKLETDNQVIENIEGEDQAIDLAEDHKTDNHKNVHQKTESRENKDHEYEHFENEDEETEERVVPSDSESTESFEVEIGPMDTAEDVKIEDTSADDSVIKTEVHTVVLQNIPLEEHEVPIVDNEYETTDGNLICYVIEPGEHVSETVIGHDGVNEVWELSEYQEDDEMENMYVANEEEITEEIVDHQMSTENDTMDSQYLGGANNEENKEAVDMKPETKEDFSCTLCNRSFKTGIGLKRHIAVTHTKDERQDDPLTFQLCLCCGEPLDTAHKVGDFACEICDSLFLQLGSLDRHRSIEHAENEVYKCVDCNRIVENKHELMEHMQIHPIIKFTCKECNRDFSRKYHLDRHVMQMGCNGTPIVEYTCEVCKKVFRRRDNLREHLKGHTGEAKKKKLYICGYCDKTFQGSALLTIHVRTHTGEKPFPCDFCEKCFPSSGAMKKHRRMHTGEKPYECRECKTRFAAKETLNRHMRTHTGDKPHQCPFCGKSFIQAVQLRAHIFHHTGENAYTCPHCNRAFNRKLRLTTHIKYVHEGAKPLQCETCEKTFFRKEDLARHALCHTGERPYACQICQKSFAVKSSLKIHMYTHRKEPPCSCETCGRAFIRQDCLLRHMRARHRDVLEDIMAAAEKKRLQQQLLRAVSDAANNKNLMENVVWNELTLTESIKELLTLLVEEECLAEFGYPDAPVDKVLDSVIKKCGHKPASEEDFDYIGRMRENAKLLFTVVIDDDAVKALLNNQTVDEVILHVLRLAKNPE